MCPWKTGLPGTEALAKITCKLFHLVFWSLSFPPSSFHLSSQPPFLHSAHSFRSTVLRWFTCTEQCLERLGINRSEDHVCTIGLPSIYDSIKRAVLLGWKIAANKRTHIKIVSHRCSAARCSQFSGELSAFCALRRTWRDRAALPGDLTVWSCPWPAWNHSPSDEPKTCSDLLTYLQREFQTWIKKTFLQTKNCWSLE